MSENVKGDKQVEQVAFPYSPKEIIDQQYPKMLRENLLGYKRKTWRTAAQLKV